MSISRAAPRPIDPEIALIRAALLAGNFSIIAVILYRVIP